MKADDSHQAQQAIAKNNSQAREAEDAGDVPRAIELYEASIRINYAHEEAYSRLVILYRKQKRFKDELRVLNRGIKLFSDHQKKQQAAHLSGKKNKGRLADLSQAFMKGSGLIDRKGKQTFYPEPVNTWMKRKALVEKKLGM